MHTYIYIYVVTQSSGLSVNTVSTLPFVLKFEIAFSISQLPQIFFSFVIPKIRVGSGDTLCHSSSDWLYENLLIFSFHLIN